MSYKDLLNADDSIFNTVDFFAGTETTQNDTKPNKNLKNREEKLSASSLKKNTSDDDETMFLKPLEPDKKLVPKPDTDELQNSTQSKEFDAFATYLNIDQEKMKASQLSQFFRNPRLTQNINSNTSNNLASQVVEANLKSMGKLDDFFNDSNREEFEKFFDQVQHSISVLGTETEQVTDQKMTEVIDVLFADDGFPEVVPLEQSYLDSSNDSLSNVSFRGMMKNKLLANAVKTPKINQIVNLSVTTQKKVFNELGPFYGLPTKVKDLIALYKGINKLYDWQDECLNLEAIKNRTNLVYALPTSGGKTLVAEILMLREIMCYSRNALFILPYVAIVQEKIWSMSPFAVALNFLVEEYAASKGTYPPRKRRRKNSIFVATIEKAIGLLNSLIETDRINELGLIVVDELHLLGEQGRGATLESLLTKIMYINAEIHIVGMSATIGNINEISKFLNAQIYMQNFRPVELTEYVKCGSEIAKVNWNSSSEELFTVVRNTDFNYSDSANLIDPDRIGGLVMEIIPTGSCLVFCASKKNCENVAHLLCRVANKKLLEHKKEEKEQVLHALKDDGGTLCNILKFSIPFGIAYHHSGLTNEERRTIEDAFRAEVISVICCTSTLAAGVNLPAQRVILRQPYIGREFINLSRYKQMVGRAGRAGLGEAGDSILICNPQDLPKVKKMFKAPMNDALSSLHDGNGKGLRHLLLSCISLGIANTRRQLQQVSKATLLAIQCSRLGVDLRKLTDKVISDLFKLGALQETDLTVSDSPLKDVSIKFDTSSASLSLINIDEDSKNSKRRKIVLKSDTKLVISKLGCAAIKGNFELTRAHVLYDDLHQAQKSLVLVDALHLLYLVTPYEISEQIRPNKNDYYNIYCKLDQKQMQTACILGIDDSVALKMLSNQQIKTVPEKVLNRFYLTLVLHDLWNEQTIFDVSHKYQIDRGIVQNLMTSAATFSANIVNFCEGLDEFWTFAHLIKGMGQRLSHCCVKELMPLMELPAVKQSRAKQLFNAGFKTLQSIAATNEDVLVENIEFMPRRVAKQLIAAAKMLLLEKVENLREEAEDVMDGVENIPPNPVQS